MNKENYKAIFANKDFQNELITFLHNNLSCDKKYDNSWEGDVVEITLCGKFIIRVLINNDRIYNRSYNTNPIYRVDRISICSNSKY